MQQQSPQQRQKKPSKKNNLAHIKFSNQNEDEEFHQKKLQKMAKFVQ